MIRPVIGLIRALQSNTASGEVAAGVVLALYFGLVPLAGTQLIFLTLLFFFLKINRAATALSLPLVKLVYWLGASAAGDAVGYALLVQAEPLKPLWAWVTRAPVLALLNLNHTTVLGGWTLAAALSWPVYRLTIAGIGLYHARVAVSIGKWQIVRWLKGLSIVRWLASWWPQE